MHLGMVAALGFQPKFYFKKVNMANTKTDSKTDFSFSDFKTELKREWMMRRYQKLTQGEVMLEEKVMGFFIHIKTHLVVSWRSVVKRTLDIACCTLALIFFAPVILIVALLIKGDSKGPMLYEQIRVGKKGRLFKIYKFRTMIVDAEEKCGPVWAKTDDPRVTRIGKFLRKSHLDELPQLVNVLLGDMSIVGPRPERPYFVNELRKLIPHYDRRFYAKPGITGLAQIKRHYDETIADVKKKLRYDSLYIQKMCPLLDLKVMMMTVGSVIFQTGR